MIDLFEKIECILKHNIRTYYFSRRENISMGLTVGQLSDVVVGLMPLRVVIRLRLVAAQHFLFLVRKLTLQTQ